MAKRKAESGKRVAGGPARGRPPLPPLAKGGRKRARAPGVEARLVALEGILAGDRPRGELERRALERQVADLESGQRRGLVWDEGAAERGVRFYSLLNHWKGEWAGQPYVLEPWQEHGIIAPLFGWRRADGLRRFRMAYIEIPRKNGKTTLAAGIALQGLVADGEAGAEVYAAATKRDQAQICFTDAKRMAGPALKRLLEVYAHSIVCGSLGSSFKPLSADYDSLDGLHIHRAIVDELHAHKSRKLWDVLLTGTGARRQPLIVAITTAGDDEQTICGEVRGLARSVLEGGAGHDDSLFAWISCAETEDDWLDPATWWKANPNLHVTIRRDYLDDLAKKARVSRAAENNFRRKHLNQWITGASEWIPARNWSACRVDPWPDLAGRELFAAVDLGWRDDFAALGRVWPEREIAAAAATAQPAAGDPGAGGSDPPCPPLQRGGESEAGTGLVRSLVRRAHVDCVLWVPAEGRRDIRAAPLCNWIERGLVRVVPGNATDPDVIFRELQADAQKYSLRQVAIDPNNARQFGQALVASGLDVFEFWQSKRNYHEPVVEFATAVAQKRIVQPGHDVLSWMVGNVRLDQSSAGYMMPTKAKSPEKIDGVVAILMAYGLAMFSDVQALDWYVSNELEVG